ncbi:MATE family efflux transporter [Clostridium sp. AN503]|uniref:MATE family efflux transporter n=1 Tax=Clostridium sp. AN503 TaxID=3160598 RepID=UPI0034580873
MSGSNDLTKGSLIRTVILFAIPFLLANLIQALYGAVDLMIVGWYCEKEAVAAVSTGTQVTQIITSIISGLTMSGTVMVGSYVGRKRPEDVKETISTSLCLFFMTGVVLSVLLFLFTVPVLRILKTPEEAFAQAKQYVNVCACGVVFICGYNAISAVLRGYGDSKSPLLFVAIAGCMNVAGDIILVKYFGMGVKGTALATIASQGFSMVCAMVYLNRRDFIFKFHLSNFRIHGQKVRELMRIGIPISLQECMVRFSFLYLTSVTNALGVSAASAVGIASKYDVFAMLPATSIASALASIVAQNYGAGKHERMNRSLWVGIMAAAPFSFAFFLWAQFSPETMIGVFTKDASVIAAGIPFFKTCSYDYLCVLLVFAMNGYLNGRSRTIFTMLSCCFGALVLRVPLIYLVCRYVPENLGVIGMVAPVVSGIMAVYTTVYVLRLMSAREAAV